MIRRLLARVFGRRRKRGLDLSTPEPLRRLALYNLCNHIDQTTLKRRRRRPF